MADRIEWTTEEPQPARTVRHWLVRCNTGDAIASLATGSDVAEWLNAAPCAVRYYVLNSALNAAPYATVRREAEEWKARAENAERGVETVEGYLRDVLRVLGGQGDELAVEAAERVVKERDSAISRSTDLQSQRDAIATELRSVAAALGLSTDDTIESLAARCRTAVALWEVGKLRRRAETAERELAELRKSTESVAEFNAMRDERDMWMGEAKWYKRLGEGAAHDCVRMIEERDDAIRDRDNAQSARDVATSELALAKESIRNLEEEINAEVAKSERLRGELENEKRISSGNKSTGERFIADYQRSTARVADLIADRDAANARAEKDEEDAASWRRVSERLQQELNEAKAAKAPASLPETELAPGSRWEGDILRSSNGSDLRFAVHGGVASLELAHDREDGGWCKVSDTIAVLRRAGMLHDEGVPREQLYQLIVRCIEAGIGNTFIGRKSATGEIADRILADYDREKGDKP